MWTTRYGMNGLVFQPRCKRQIPCPPHPPHTRPEQTCGQHNGYGGHRSSFPWTKLKQNYSLPSALRLSTVVTLPPPTPLWVNGMSQRDLDTSSWWERGRRNEFSWNVTILEQVFRIPMLCMLRQINKTVISPSWDGRWKQYCRLSALHCYFSVHFIENEKNLTNKAVEPRQEIDPKGENGASYGRLFSSTSLRNVFN